MTKPFLAFARCTQSNSARVSLILLVSGSRIMAFLITLVGPDRAPGIDNTFRD